MKRPPWILLFMLSMLIVVASTAVVALALAWFIPVEGREDVAPELWRGPLSAFVGVGLSRLVRDKWDLP